MDDWNHVSSVIASLVGLEEECTVELANAVGSSTPSGASLRQLAANVMGIRVELRLDMRGNFTPPTLLIPLCYLSSRRTDRRILMENCQRLYWQSRYPVIEYSDRFISLFLRVLSRSIESIRTVHRGEAPDPTNPFGCSSCCLHGSLQLPSPYHANI